MKAKPKQSGATLMEMTVVIAIIAMLAGLGLPAVRALLDSVQSQGGARCMIGAALASARAVAAREQRYAGIRFQNKYQQDNKGCQYMIFIMHDQPNTELANGFRAVEGLEPIKLPDSVGVMEVINSNAEIYGSKVVDKTTFSIVFSPSGKLVIHPVRVRNRDGKTNDTSDDDIFNIRSNVENGIGMFIQDSSSDEEPSRNGFIIYDRSIFEKVAENRRWSDYLEGLDVICINPYTGTMINR